MSVYLLTLKDSGNRNFFLDLVKHLDFVEDVSEIKYNPRLVLDMNEALDAVELHRWGKKKLKTARQLLDEL